MDLKLPNSNIKYYNKIFNPTESYCHYQYLLKLPNWEKRDIIICGKKCKQNRLTCFFSTDTDTDYCYSGINNTGSLFTSELLEIKQKVENIFDNKYIFNYCLLNYYENGNQNIGMHSDDETDLKYPVIASVSFGAERYFDFHNKYDKNIKKRMNLENGSMVVMDGTTQKYYKHGVPVQKKIKTGRINLTFRIVNTKDDIKQNYKIIKTMKFKKYLHNN
jgi:alkylated DNA repair dioxygenase AlkB